MEPYKPVSLPPKSIDWIKHIPEISKANMALGEYKGMLLSIINPFLFLTPLTYREAIISSRIEGTQTTVEEVMEFEVEEEQVVYSEEKKSAQEVANYRKAMEWAVSSLETRPLSINTIREIHRVLLTSVRGANKNPGEIRNTQNWIGPKGTPIEKAIFIPPDPLSVWDALTQWESYLHSDQIEPLVQLAIAKAQFELIHPFNDGNGRIGRMLVPLILYNKKILSSPTFYISAYIEQHEDIYRERLGAISRENDWDGWISFFLQAISEQSKDNCEKAKAIIDLYGYMKQKIPEIIKSKYNIKVVDTIFSIPIFNKSTFSNKYGIPTESAPWILNKLKDDKIIEIHRKGSGRRGPVYIFSKLIQIIK